MKRSMNIEEQMLKQRFGSKAPFNVPENYFESFADKFMDKLPETAPQGVRMRPWWYRYRVSVVAAAFVGAVVLSVGAWMYTGNTEQPHVAGVQAGYSYATMDDVVNYTMMDNEDIYASLMDN